ncbi:MAG: bifunctional diaminohydroxyphosphoribosylaminopyrimidine deaminase/5-amino-6-(5-phosphoribosylamino)uracil reductase RibD [Abditibacteriaceae bacterium]
MTNIDDRKWMEAALQWAAKGKGWNSPRPSVGCALVKDGELIGIGHTQRGDGQPHAEVMALQDAAHRGGSTFGATAYVTLEPCSHYATTPPCTIALIEAGIAQVVVGVRDPNPLINGRGYQQLQEAGIEVVTNFMSRECARHDEHFLKHISTSSPFVTLKSAVSLDGKIALKNGSSQWITGEAARERAHLLRHCHDAVLIGSGTAMMDNPQLSVRLEGAHKQPARVVIDSKGCLSPDLKMFDKSTFNVPVYVATTSEISEQKRDKLEQRGVKVLLLPGKEDHVDIKILLQELYSLGICSVLVEGGAHLSGVFLREQLVDKVVCFVAPMIIGEGISLTADLEVNSLSEALRLQDVQTAIFGEDVEISGYLDPWASQMKELCG